MAARRAWISGITGQDGAYLAKSLLAKGYEVWGGSRSLSQSSANLVALGIADRVQLQPVAWTDRQSLRVMIESARPDEIYHLAGQSSVGLSFSEPRETWESIATATLNLLEVVKECAPSIRIYHAGSSECFGDTRGHIIDETTPFRPQNPYAIAKVAATEWVRYYRDVCGLFACSGVLFNHESPLRSSRFVTRKIVAAACRIAAGSTETLQLGDLSIERDWGWAPEYVESMYLMLRQEKADDFIIATGHTISLERFTEIAFAAVGKDWRDHVSGDARLYRSGDARVVRANPEKAWRQLGWRACVRAEDVIARLVAVEALNQNGSGSKSREWGVD